MEGSVCRGDLFAVSAQKKENEFCICKIRFPDILVILNRSVFYAVFGFLIIDHGHNGGDLFFHEIFVKTFVSVG